MLIIHNGAWWTEGPYEKFQFYIFPMKNLFFLLGIFWTIVYLSKWHDGIVQYAAFRMGHQFLPFFYVKSWSNLTPNGSFKICSLWRFENTPYMLNLMKFWLRYLRLKTIYIFQKLISFHLFHCQLSPIFLHQIQRSGTDFFSARHEDSKTVIDYWNW